MTNLTIRRAAVLAACTTWAMTSVGCDLGEPPRTFPGLAVVGTGDVDGDGNLDFVTIDSPYALEGLTVRLGDGTGGFPSSQHVPMRSAHCTVGRDCAGFDHIYLEDFTGDGVVDLAMEATRRYPDRPGDDAMELRVNDGAGRFGEPVVIHPSDADWWGDFGDVTGDGLPDMIRMDSPGPGGPVQIVTQRNDGSGGFGPPVASPGEPEAGGIDVADFDADGHADLLIFGECIADESDAYGRRCVEVRRGDSSGVFPPGEVVLAPDPAAYSLSFPRITHLDDDGHLDVVGTRGRQPVTAFYGDGRGGFTPAPVATPAGTIDLTTADFDVDGHTDLLVTTDDRDADKLDDWSRIAFGDGAGGFGPARVTGGARATVADFDADGRPDYVASAWSCDCALPDRIEVYMNAWSGRPG